MKRRLLQVVALSVALIGILYGCRSKPLTPVQEAIKVLEVGPGPPMSPEIVNKLLKR